MISRYIFCQLYDKTTIENYYKKKKNISFLRLCEKTDKKVERVYICRYNKVK